MDKTERSKYRITYNRFETDLLEAKLGKSLKEIVEDYVQTDFELEQFSIRFAKAELMWDLLTTELENSLEISRVMGLKPNQAYARAHKALYTAYNEYK